MAKVHRTFRTINFREMSLCVVAIVAMCVSAVSACACTHHQPQPVADEPSCHSSSHVEISQAETDRPQSDSFDGNCSCFINEPVPAIVSKTESKKIAFENTERDINVFVPTDRPLLFDLKQEGGVVDAEELNYSSHLLGSGPCRAPPRL